VAEDVAGLEEEGGEKEGGGECLHCRVVVRSEGGGRVATVEESLGREAETRVGGKESEREGEFTAASYKKQREDGGSLGGDSEGEGQRGRWSEGNKQD
jgi:hypothetical protein